MFRGVPSSHCSFVPKYPQVALALSHQAGDGLEAVPEGMKITVYHGAGKESLGFSSLFFPIFYLKSRANKVPPLGFAGIL